MHLSKLLPGNRICLVSWIDKNDLRAKKLADAILLNAIIEDISKMGYTCSYFYNGEFGHIDLLMKLFWKFKKKKTENSVIKQHVILSSVFNLFISFYSLLSFGFKNDVKEKLGAFDAIIVLGPSLLAPIYNVFKGKKYLLLYELNIEFILYNFNAGPKWRYVNRVISALIKKMETRSIQLSNVIMTISPRDCSTLKMLYSSKEIFYYYPFFNREVSTVVKRPLKVVDSKRNRKIALNIKDTVIGFIGSCSIVNCKALLGIISIVRAVNLSNLIFLVSGNISNCFCARNLPDGIIFTGFIENLDVLMPTCDAFILFDVQPTGIEGKVQSYKVYNKPVLLISDESVSNYSQFLGSQGLRLKNTEEAVIYIRNMVKKKLDA